MTDDVGLRFEIITDLATLGVAGKDTTIFNLPPQFYVDLDGEKVFVAQAFMRFIRALAERQAAALGERLHHASFTITRDPEQVESLGMFHDCDVCHAGVAEALKMMEKRPGIEMVVGQLFWSAA